MKTFFTAFFCSSFVMGSLISFTQAQIPGGIKDGNPSAPTSERDVSVPIDSSAKKVGDNSGRADRQLGGEKPSSYSRDGDTTNENDTSALENQNPSNRRPGLAVLPTAVPTR